FINTHLESFDPGLRFLQTFELLSGPANTELPVILVGDLNSGPTEPGPFVAYANLLANGFVDTWALANPSDPGVTCCNAENLLNPDPLSLPEGRIDHVLARPAARVIRAKLVGIDQDERTPSGLWPSDHAGVITTLAP
ncbi:MAG: endonuclease/exonuclease/phosphatase family protein, partial [Acidobacteriota bacterium]|nr:endonuclease/exonuclease/phosphatase family protein [Acidobacteriota bacterium]